MSNKKPLIRFIAIGLMSLCLSTWLIGCAQEPTLQAVYVSRPVTSNLDLLCKPTVPQPPSKMTNGDLDNYVLVLQDQIRECARQQDEYRTEVDRLVKRAEKRK